MPEKEKKEKKEKKAKDSDEEEEEPDFGKKEKKEKKDKKEKKEKRKPVPTVCKVIEVSPVPKKDKLKVCKVVIREDLEPVNIVTNVTNVVAGGKFLIALPGVTTADGIEVKEAKVGGVESSGMFVGPIQMGWDTDELDEKLAIQVSDDMDPGELAPSYDDALDALHDREQAAAAAKAAEEAAKAKKDEPAPAASKGKKDKKKGKAAKADEDDDLDALLDEFKDENKAEEPAAKEEAASPAAAKEEEDAKTLANRKKKEKKKGAKGGGGDDDDDFEAALGEFKDEGKDDAPKEEAPKDAKDDAKEEELLDKIDGNKPAGGDAEAEELDAKTLANRKKKEKKKAKGGAVGGEGMWGDDDEKKEVAKDGDGAAEETPKAEPKSKGKAKAAPKKESAIVKAARERLEAEAKLEAERKAFEEAERARIAEEERIEREQREAEEAEREKKRKARQDKIERQKAEGTYMTKAAKARAARAKMLREQFGFDMDGEEGREAEEEEEEKPAQPQKRPIATKLKKKKPQQKAEDDDAPAPAKEDEAQKFEPPERKPSKDEEAAKPAEESDDDGGWEDAAEKGAFEETAKEEEGSGSDSDSDGSGSDSGSGSGSDSDDSDDSFMGYRSPIIVIMGHVDTGKTKLLDKIRRTNVQEGEAGGITQQIGATFFPDIALQEQTKKVDKNFELEVPGIMVIDTPGHESFNNLRKRGSSLCDLAILVIDIMHGLEPQTVESLELLKKRKCPFVIALNKVDVCYQWNSKTYTPIREALDRQEQFVRDEFRQRYDKVMLQLNERGLNVALYWENDDYRRNISIVPTSALTGEGVPDLLYMLINLSQNLMASKLEVEEELQCTVIEVKTIEGLGTTIDVILVNGTLREGDQIVLAGMGGPIVTTIRALLTPQPMKEMRVKSEYVHHAMINQSMGIKICAPGLEEAVAGTELQVVGPDDDIEELKDNVDDDFDSILNNFEKQGEGVYVKASTLGSLEALLDFLQSMKIPVFDVGIGEVFKKDVKKAMVMKEKKHPEYACILCFDVKVNAEAKQQATTDGVQIFTADIIYHLFDKFTQYMDKINADKKQERREEAVFPCVLEIDRNHVFMKKDPILFACTVVGGQLRKGTPICIPEKDNLEIGRVAGIEKDKKPVEKARKGDVVCVKIEQNTGQNHIAYGRHFDATNRLYSKVTRSSIDTLKENFRDEMNKEDWELMVGLKKVFQID